MNSSSFPPAIVLGMSPTGLAIIRSLGRRSIPIVGIDKNRRAIGQFSKYITEKYILPSSEWEEQLFKLLIKIGTQSQEKPVIFCSEDVYISFFADRWQRLKELFRFPSSLNHDTIQTLLDKERFYRMCMETGIDIPSTSFPKSHNEVKHLAETLQYPAILKPNYSHLWRKKLKGEKMVEVHSPDELVKTYDALSKFDTGLMIQEVIPGGDDYIYVCGVSFDQASKPLAIFTGRKLRQFPPQYGSASCAESLWVSEVADLSQKILKYMNFHGICGTEFKRDPRDGKFKMIEINLRPVLWFSLVEASGVDLIAATYFELISQPIGSYRQIDGIRWIYTARDLVTVAKYLTTRRIVIGDWMRTLRNIQAHAIFALEDPAVTLGAPAYLAKEFLDYAVGRGS